jgi:hypothetical protein
MWSGVHSVLITPVSVASRRATGWTVGAGFSAGADVPILHNVQTCSGAHPASYPMTTGGSFSGCKTVGAWSWDTTRIAKWWSCWEQARINEEFKAKFNWKINMKWSTLHSYHSYVRGVSKGYGLEGRGSISGRGEMFLFSTTSKPVPGPTQVPI